MSMKHEGLRVLAFLSLISITDHLLKAYLPKKPHIYLSQQKKGLKPVLADPGRSLVYVLFDVVSCPAVSFSGLFEWKLDVGEREAFQRKVLNQLSRHQEKRLFNLLLKV